MISNYSAGESIDYKPKYKIGDVLVQPRHGDLHIKGLVYRSDSTYLTGWKYIADVDFGGGCTSSSLEFHAYFIDLDNWKLKIPPEKFEGELDFEC